MLAQRVIQATAADEHIPAFDPVRAEERAAFVDALKLLEHYGAVTTVDGATDAYLDSEEAKVLDAPWDPGLADALRTHGAAVPEELVAERLLADLEARSSSITSR
jgi:uncharacterized protein (TIGR02678 family)